MKLVSESIFTLLFDYKGMLIQNTDPGRCKKLFRGKSMEGILDVVVLSFHLRYSVLHEKK